MRHILLLYVWLFKYLVNSYHTCQIELYCSYSLLFKCVCCMGTALACVSVAYTGGVLAGWADGARCPVGNLSSSADPSPPVTLRPPSLPILMFSYLLIISPVYPVITWSPFRGTQEDIWLCWRPASSTLSFMKQDKGLWVSSWWGIPPLASLALNAMTWLFFSYCTNLIASQIPLLWAALSQAGMQSFLSLILA